MTTVLEVLSTDPERHKVLAEFLRQEHKLRALRFLPDIIKLQRLLVEKFHRRFDREEAQGLKIQDFLEKITSITERIELESLIASFKNAWNHVRLSLNEDGPGRLRPPKDLCEQVMNDKSPIAVLLPNGEGKGICSLALVFFLTTVHNDFNERYQNLIGERVKDLPHIQLQNVMRSHLISYDIQQDLLPLIMAQCSYSLEVGRGTLVYYNWEALERQLIDRFLRGKPIIDFKDERFSFSKDVHLHSVFTKVRNKVPQVPLSPAVSTQILAEFHSLEDVCDFLKSLDIGISFLSSTGGQPETSLNYYVESVLRMPRPIRQFSQKAGQYCQLKHVLSLWRVLSLQRATLFIRRHEDPFEQIPDMFKEKMPVKLKMKFIKSLPMIDLDRFVFEVLELIALNIAGESPDKNDTSLKLYVEWHLDNKGHLPIPGLDQLPEDLKLTHVIDVWKTSVEEREAFWL